MKRLGSFLDEFQGERDCKELSLTGIFLIALLVCLLQPSNGFAEYKFWWKWGMSGSTGPEYAPAAVAVDSLGNVYVVDGAYNRIQKFTSDGTYLTQWGSMGSGNGQFNFPTAVAVDKTGNVYVLDGDVDYYRVQKFRSDGTYLTQWGSIGTGNGQFQDPIGVAVDDSGNVYVADMGNDRIQKFTSDGTYLTQWGSMGTGNGQFLVPSGVAVDVSRNVYVVDSSGFRIQKFTSSGAYLSQWTTQDMGNVDINDRPHGVAVDSSGNVYVSKPNSSRISKYTSSGTYLTQWGTYGTGDGQLASPTGVAVDSSGNVFVADTSNHRIQKFTSGGTYLTQWGDYGTVDAESWSPSGVAVSDSDAISVYVYVADEFYHRIQKFDSFGWDLSMWGSIGTGNGQFQDPKGVAVDSSGNVFVADTSNHRIQKFASSGTYLTQWGTYGTGDGQFASPTGVAVDSSGNVFVADTSNHRIQKFTSGGTYLTQWGSIGTGNGQFQDPKGVAVDSSGNVYVADTGNHRIQRFYIVAPPTLVTVTPLLVTSAENEVQNFSTVYSDENGYRDLKHVYLRVGSCMNGIEVIYGSRYNLLYLVNDECTAYAGYCTPEEAGTLTNTQGTLDCGLTTVSGTGNDLTVNWRIKPNASFAGTKNLYLFARDYRDATVGWEDKGDWTITSPTVVAPTLGAITPSVVTSGENVAQTFNAVYSDENGYSNLKHVYVKVGSLVNGMVAIYYTWVNKLYLVNDAGTGYVGNCTPGVAGTLTNGQGTLDCGLTTVSGNGNDLTVNWNITPKASFAGTKDLFLYARDNADLTAGWEDKGDWTITSPTVVAPTLGAITPSVVTSGENVAQGFNAVYSDENGYSNLKHVYVKVGSLVNGMVAIYYTWVNKLYLVNDAGTGYVGNCTPGVAGTLTNGQGTLDCGLTTVSGNGNDLTVNWNITPKASFAGTKDLFLYARDNADLTAGWEDKGDWTISQPPE